MVIRIRYFFYHHYKVEKVEVISMLSKGFSRYALKQVSINRSFAYLFRDCET
ncbi:uncharacterized protein METZ01_LOCUS493366 [marine metagenome]|uniref:Uncharacterized protein n=1 Tax=marine metagenome TaxID=408172 RepID=A0A383D7P6_9ZZZZ